MIDIKKVIRVLVPILVVAFVLLSLPSVCGHGHGHSHDGGHGHSHDEPAHFKYSKEANTKQHAEPEPTKKHTHESGSPTQSRPSWVEPILATLLISVAPVPILFFFPISNSVEHQPILKILLAFGAGGLLGDAFLHLIPHALMAQQEKSGGPHSHSHSHGASPDGDHEGHSHDMTIGMSILGGVIVFLMIEKAMRIYKVGHSHSHAAPAVAQKKSKKDKNSDDEEEEDHEVAAESAGEIKVAGYLNIAADTIHNLTDGLAIGASFLAGRSVGIATTVMVLLHELPHEIGDFAILVQSGISRKKAMLLQLVTAGGAMVGCLISLMAEGADPAWVTPIIPFTAGGFIYIATVSVIPELLEQTSLRQSVWEILALLAGVGMMVVIVFLE